MYWPVSNCCKRQIQPFLETLPPKPTLMLRHFKTIVHEMLYFYKTNTIKFSTLCIEITHLNLLPEKVTVYLVL